MVHNVHSSNENVPQKIHLLLWSAKDFYHKFGNWEEKKYLVQDIHGKLLSINVYDDPTCVK
jgi:hypothetical protein